MNFILQLNLPQVYNPLGLLAPAVIIAKLLLQNVWLNKLDWDNEVPKTIATTWDKFLADLQHLHDIKIPRYVISENCKELHIFTDASKNVYGACAYVRSCHKNCNNRIPVSVRLLCA